MRFEGTQLARVLLSIHAADIEQAARCPAWRSAARIERHIVIYQGGNRAICWLGCLLERIGLRLREYGMTRPLPLGSSAAQR
jgi:hypothetical protein